MDRIELDPEFVIDIEAIALRVQGLRVAFVNVFAIEDCDGSWTLIDAGLPGSASRIQDWAEKQFMRPPKAILLTHGHFDHAGSARTLADNWQVPVLAHPREFPYLTGRLEYPKPNVGAGGGLMSLLSPLYPRGPIDLGEWLKPLPSEATASLTDLAGWQILHTPGHTPGHVSLYRPEDGLLLAGDAFCTTKPESFFEAAVLQQPELHGPPAYFTWDWDLARESVRILAGLAPSIVAPGHGKPLGGATVAASLNQLAARFDEVAVPSNRE